ncbi:MAG TPA: hypothetical protein VIH42_11650 [Thermoguttaceae bacterium]
MNPLPTFKTRWGLLIVLLLTILFTLPSTSSSDARGSGAIDSPISTPPAPQSTLTPSTESRIARDYIAAQYGLPAERLVASDEHRRHYPELGRMFVALSLFDPVSNRAFKPMVDLKDHSVIENVDTIEKAEAEAAFKKYGKLEPALYERLQHAADNDLTRLLCFAIWQVNRHVAASTCCFANNWAKISWAFWPS